MSSNLIPSYRTFAMDSSIASDILYMVSDGVSARVNSPARQREMEKNGLNFYRKFRGDREKMPNDSNLKESQSGSLEIRLG